MKDVFRRHEQQNVTTCSQANHLFNLTEINLLCCIRSSFKIWKLLRKLLGHFVHGRGERTYFKQEGTFSIINKYHITAKGTLSVNCIKWMITIRICWHEIARFSLSNSWQAKCCGELLRQKSSFLQSSCRILWKNITNCRNEELNWKNFKYLAEGAKI